MFERPILIYSDYCIHSTNFINALMKHQELFDNFIRINIDVNPATRQRPKIFYDIQSQLNHKITEIPTIIVDKAEYILTGVDAFKWLDFTTTEVEPEKELIPFNNVEMGSFSDSYSPFGSSDLNDAKEQTFKFVNKPDEKINTPQESNERLSKDDYSKKQKERESFDNIQNNGRDGRNDGGRGGNGQQSYQQNFQPQSIQPQFNPKYQQGAFSEKQKDIDSKLQQMILDRQNGGNVQQYEGQSIDFKSGKIN